MRYPDSAGCTKNEEEPLIWQKYPPVAFNVAFDNTGPAEHQVDLACGRLRHSDPMLDHISTDRRYPLRETSETRCCLDLAEDRLEMTPAPMMQ
jgi:hypothetical protein